LNTLSHISQRNSLIDDVAAADATDKFDDRLLPFLLSIDDMFDDVDNVGIWICPVDDMLGDEGAIALCGIISSSYDMLVPVDVVPVTIC
jgi:hypothetical protein